MAGLLDQFLGNPEGGSGLLGNSAFRLGLGLLQSRYDRRINPATAGLSGLLGAQQYRGDYATQQEQMSQQKADAALRQTLPGLIDPGRNQPFDPNTGMFNTDQSQGLLGQYSASIADLASADPKSAMAIIPGLLAAEKSGSTHYPKGTVGSPLLLTNGHAGQARVDPYDPTKPPTLWDMTDNAQAAPGVGIAAQPQLAFDKSGQGWQFSKTDGPTPVEGLSSTDVQGRVQGVDKMQTQYNYWKDLPAKENQIDALQSQADYLLNKDTPLAHSVFSYFPTLRGSDTSNWEVAQKQFIANNTIGTLVNMRSDKTGATGFGALQEKELDLVLSAAQRASQATSQKDWKDAMTTYNYWLDQTRKQARQLSGLTPEDASRNLRTAPVPAEATGGAPAPVPPGAPAYINPNTPPAGVDPAVWAKYGKPSG
jgi:hypothetical protein